MTLAIVHMYVLQCYHESINAIKLAKHIFYISIYPSRVARTTNSEALAILLYCSFVFPEKDETTDYVPLIVGIVGGIIFIIIVILVCYLFAKKRRRSSSGLLMLFVVVHLHGKLVAFSIFNLPH